MIIRSKQITKRRRTIPFLIIFVFYTFFIYTLQYLYHDQLFQYSLKLTSLVNRNQTLRNYLPTFEVIVNLLGSYKAFIIFTLLMFNMANIYKTFILMLSISLGYLVGGCLKIMLYQPLMYYADYNVEKLGLVISPIICSGTWGQPSVYSVTTTCVYFTLWKIIFDNSRLREKIWAKIACLILIISIILFVNFSNFLAALHSADQVIFGMLIGFQIFFFIFYIIHIDLNDGKVLVKIVKFKFIYLFMINIFICGTVMIIYFFGGADEKILEKYQNTINKSKCANISNNLRLNQDAIILICIFFNNMSVILSMKCEFKYIFKSNELNWRQYNFGKENGEDDSFLSKLSISRELQWNHTKIVLTFLRTVLIIFFHAILLIPFILLNFGENFFIVIFIKVLLPLNYSVFFMFYFEKIILRKFKITNDAIFKLMSENF